LFELFLKFKDRQAFILLLHISGGISRKNTAFSILYNTPTSKN
ncbi:hypothetical protein EZS27_019805, partial [termite gut metagenome]